jgi:hypothetical protein
MIKALNILFFLAIADIMQNVFLLVGLIVFEKSAYEIT